MKNLSVVELFAGVGGFRLGLESQTYRKAGFKVIWSNQWEPNSKSQHASDIYQRHFGTCNHICEDIEKVPTTKIPDHDVLVGGFPCQDYSVAKPQSQSKGLKGKSAKRT